MTELLPETALDRAAYLDSYLNRHGKPIGPLHGLPISVKEHVGMKGRILDAGFISWRDRIAEEDAHILTILLDAGAVLYVRTTQPQTLMHLETSSNLYGETVNPFNRALTSGGSSGGVFCPFHFLILMPAIYISLRGVTNGLTPLCRRRRPHRYARQPFGDRNRHWRQHSVPSRQLRSVWPPTNQFPATDGWYGSSHDGSGADYPCNRAPINEFGRREVVHENSNCCEALG